MACCVVVPSGNFDLCESLFVEVKNEDMMIPLFNASTGAAGYVVVERQITTLPSDGIRNELTFLDSATTSSAGQHHG